MELLLKTKAKEKSCTIGDLYINGALFCNTLEDTVRDFGVNGEGKIPKETAIPAGRYRVTLEYSPRFKKKLPYLHNVKYFTGIMIHGATNAKDVEGCIGVGKNTTKGNLTDSQLTLNKLLLIFETQTEEIWITVER